MLDGKCYQHITDRTSFTFWKYVDPDYTCIDVDGITECSYIDSIKQRSLGPSYGVLPPVPPIDEAHELLFRIAVVDGVLFQCQPYSFFAGIPGGDSIPWGGGGIGGPTNPPDGLGEPSYYISANHLIVQPYASGGYMLPTPWDQVTTLSDMYQAVAERVIGSPYSFTYFSPDATSGSYVQWYPDFPGCDAAANVGDPSRYQYGNAGVLLVFQIFQATP
jgi:hypothetical protein